MVVFLHVVIALLSIGIASFSFFRPSTLGFRVNYGLIGATFITGMYLVIASPAHMIEACVMGVGYVVIVSALTIVARMRFTRQKKEA